MSQNPNHHGYQEVSVQGFKTRVGIYLLHSSHSLKKKLESKLNEMYNEIAKGAQIRSKSKWIEEGGKILNIFLD